MTTVTRILLALGAALVLGAVNFSIMGKESIRRGGDLVFIDLQPRDPRSLMQGDYMTLRFQLAQQIQLELEGRARDRGAPLPDGDGGLVGLALDERRVATVAKPPSAATLHLRYRVRKGAVWIGTNAFFFEEGADGRYNAARYGEFRVDPKSGEAVLVGLRDAKLEPL